MCIRRSICDSWLLLSCTSQRQQFLFALTAMFRDRAIAALAESAAAAQEQEAVRLRAAEAEAEAKKAAPEPKRNDAQEQGAADPDEAEVVFH